MADCDSIGLLGGIVEIDETFLGAKKTKDKRKAYKEKMKNKIRIQMGAEGKFEKRNRLMKLEKELAKCKRKKNMKTPQILKDIFYSLPYVNRELLRDWDVRNLMYQPFHYKKNIVGIVERNVYDVEGKLIKLGKLRLIKMGRHKTDLKRKSVSPFIEKNVSRSSHIMTDDNRIYWHLNQTFQKHSIIKHSQSGVNQEYARYVDGEVSTNTIENVWKHLKKVENGTYIQYSWKFTQSYLDEFTFRFNRRDKKPKEQFNDLLRLTLLKPIYRRDLHVNSNSYIYYPKGEKSMAFATEKITKELDD